MNPNQYPSLRSRFAPFGGDSSGFLLAILLLCFLPLMSDAQIEWTPEAQISLDDVYDDWFPSIAAGPDGRVWVVWRGIDGYDPEIMYSMNDGNGWSYPARVNTDDYADDTMPDIAIGPDGNPWVVWSKRVYGSSKLFWSKWEGNEWRPEERVFPGLGDEEPGTVASITMEHQGTPWITWSWPNSGGGRVACYSRYEDGAWSSPDTLIASPDVVGCLLGSEPSGRVWAVLPYRADYETIVLYTYWEEGVWAPMDTIPSVSGASTMVVSPAGEVWMAWSEDGVVWAAWHSEERWSEPEMIAAPDTTSPGLGSLRACCPELAVSSMGTVWAVWKEYYFGVGESDPMIYASRRGVDSWIPKEQVSSPEGFAYGYNQIVVSPSGQAWAVWQGWDGRDFEILYSHSAGMGVSNDPLAGQSRTLLRWAPNPVRGKRATWGIAASQIVGPISIYDLGGRLVRRIVAGCESGRPIRIAVYWDCRDWAGSPVQSGSYVWRTQAGGHNYEGTIIVIR